MKKLHLFLVTAIMLFAGAISCSDKTPDAKEVAQQFLEAYFSNDFHSAALLCNEEIAEVIMKASADMENMDPAVKKVVTDISSKISYEIKSAEEIDKTKIVIEYEILTPESPKAVSSYLTMDKVEKNWVITKLHK